MNIGNDNERQRRLLVEKLYYVHEPDRLEPQCPTGNIGVKSGVCAAWWHTTLG